MNYQWIFLLLLFCFCLTRLIIDGATFVHSRDRPIARFFLCLAWLHLLLFINELAIQRTGWPIVITQ